MFVSSPVHVDIESFDTFWASEMPEHDASFFADMAAAIPTKPVDLIATMVSDEDAWLFADKLGVAVRDIRVHREEPATTATTATTTACQQPLTIDVHSYHQQEEEDATSVFMEPIMGSPVDELDAMTAFMVDDVDPFQEVIFTSDDEPMSPMAPSSSSSLKTTASSSSMEFATGNRSSLPRRGICMVTEEKKLHKLRATVAHLEKIYYARCHGRATSDIDADVDIVRVKTVRCIERMQRITCGMARENFAFRATTMPQRQREALVLHEMSTVLHGAVMNEQLMRSISDKMCSDSIVATARQAAQAAMALSTTEANDQQFMGWATVKTVEPTTGVLSFVTKKEVGSVSLDSVASKSWDLLLASDQLDAFMANGNSAKTTRSHVLKKLSADAILVAFDTVVVSSSSSSSSVHVARDVCVAFCVRTSSGMMVGISSISPAVFVSTMEPVDGVSFVQNGMRWMQLSQQKTTNNNEEQDHAGSFTVVAGGFMQCESRAAADDAHVDALALVMLWERELVGPAFTL